MSGHYRPELGSLIAGLLERHRLSYTQASIRTLGAVSASYWSHLTHGRVPSREKLQVIVDAFPDDDLAGIWEAAGYAAPTGPAVPPDWREFIDAIAEARGLDPDEVVPRLLQEEYERAVKTGRKSG